MKEIGEKIRVVLVDDDADDRMLFVEVFKELRIKSELSTFENGLKFLDSLNRPKTEIPDLIFLDLNMPIMGGIETLEHLRRSEKYRDVPIAIYSTSSSESDIESTLIRGASIYITKPNSYERLKKILEDVMKIQWQYLTSPLVRDNFVMVIE